MEQVRVAIIGAGPAGTTCGLLLRKKNIDCVLIDWATFPRDKICGGGLTPRSYRLLSQLLPDFRYDYNSVHRLKLCIEGRPVLDFMMEQEIRIVKRKDFDARLLEKYQKEGGTFVNDALTAIEERDQKVIITLKSGRQIECDYLVGADGANSRVRKYLNPHSSHGILCMEQYGPKSEDNAIVGNLSRFYRQGYYYSFPNESYDVQGFGDYMTTPQMFRKVLRQMGCPDEKPLGAFIPQSIDYPLRKRIILIGDAGGFPNRLTFEGIYYAFLTAKNAAVAISSGTPFVLTNKQVFDKKKWEEYAARFFYSEIGLAILKFCCNTFPGLITWAFNRAAR
ncbi:MAG: NAD(P)/FAD-dependent oxidoreductase [Prevotella sp.]|nr:NAD(P)/FAD-dependent oxidoreductase [Prevotella sp.]